MIQLHIMKTRLKNIIKFKCKILLW